MRFGQSLAGMGLLITLMSTGCAHNRLQVNTLSQVATITGLQQQQVLDNLAKFAANPESTPFFAVVSGGTVAVNDRGQASAMLMWNPFTLVSETLNLTGERTKQHNWSLAPENNPDKLGLMRCAYQQAIGYIPENETCPDCCALRQAWHNPDELEGCIVKCIPPPGWFGRGSKKDVPHHACHVGRYCDTYVWVLPSGEDELWRLTAVILDYATGKTAAASEDPKHTSAPGTGLRPRENFHDPLRGLLTLPPP